MSESQVLYRFFDNQDRLLYVGISSNFFGRVGQHKADKAWFTQIAYSTLEHFPDRQSVDEAETVAIRAEKPLHNKKKQADYVPADYHAKQIDLGSVYTSKRFRGNHDWIKPYVESLRFPAANIKDSKASRIWLVATAYSMAKDNGHWCRSCEGLLNHASLRKVKLTK